MVNLKEINNILGEMKSALEEGKNRYFVGKDYFVWSTDSGQSPTHLFVSLNGDKKKSDDFFYYKFSPSKYKDIERHLRDYDFDFQEEFHGFYGGVSRGKYSAIDIIQSIKDLDKESDFKKIHKDRRLDRPQLFKVLSAELKIPPSFIEKEFGSFNRDDIVNFKVGHSEVVIPDNLPEKKIPEMKKLLEKVYAQFKKAGVPQLMTGPIQFAKIGGRTLGFYNAANKLITIGYNAKLDKITLQTIFHEYGHKWFYEFIGGKSSDIKKKFEDLRYNKREKFDNSDAAKVWDKFTSDLLKAITNGDRFTYEGRKRKMKGEWVIKDINGTRISLRRPDEERASVGITPLWFMDNKVKFKNNDKANKLSGLVMIPDDKNASNDWFPTKYSESSAVEWFAELFAFYMVGKLKGEPEKFIKEYLK